MKNKKGQLKELKKGIKDQKEAVRKQDLYKAVKFFGEALHPLNIRKKEDRKKIDQTKEFTRERERFE